MQRHSNALIYCKRHGITLAPADGPDILFRHLSNDYPLLRIDATDIDKKVIKMFSQKTTVGHPATPDVVVADAVAASIAVPLIFSPKVIDAGRLSACRFSPSAPWHERILDQWPEPIGTDRSSRSWPTSRSPAF